MGMARLEELRARAIRLARDGDRGPEAIETNARILELAPDDVAALNRRGRCYFERGDFGAARADYGRALKLDPASTVARNYLRKIERMDSGREAGATQRDRERVAAKSRRKAAEYEARRRKLKARERAAKRRKETASFRKAEGLTSFEEAFALGVEAKQGRDYPLAIAAFRQAFRLDKSRYDVIVRLAAVHRANKEPDEARRLYEWVLEREENRAARVGLAAIHRDQKKPLEACALYKKVLSNNPRDKHALTGLAAALADLGLREQAARAFRRADEAGDG